MISRKVFDMTISLRNLIRAALVWVFCASFVPNGYSQNQAVEQGPELYLSYGCAVCHGPSGDGQGMRKVEREKPPTNFMDRKSYRFGHDKNSIKHSIKFGIKEQGTIMPAFHHIPDEELEAISVYLISLQKED